MTTYNVSDTNLANCATQVGYIQSSLTNVETRFANGNLRQIDVDHLHMQLNALAVIAARSITDPNNSDAPLDDGYFGGSGGGNISGTNPQSGGTPKGP